MRQRSVYVIGDIHGMIDPLEELLKEIAGDAEQRQVAPFHVFVGDLVDRGPNSAAVVGRVRRMVEEGSAACVLGNHDEMFLQAVTMNRPDLLGNERAPLVNASAEAILHHWLSQGGTETVRSYRCDPNLPETWRFPTEDLQFLAHLPLYWQDEQIVVSHALPSRDALEKARRPEGGVNPQVRQELLWRREEPGLSPDPEKLHLSGHTPLHNPVLHQALNAIQLDTGCVFGLALSAYVADTAQVLSVFCGK